MSDVDAERGRRRADGRRGWTERRARTAADIKYRLSPVNVSNVDDAAAEVTEELRAHTAIC